MVYTKILLLVLVGVVYIHARSGLRWDVRESDGRLVRSLSDGQEMLTLEYNKKEELVQCWKGKHGKDSDAIALMFYSAMSDVTAVRKDAIDIDMKEVKRDCKRYMQQVEVMDNMTDVRQEVENINALRETVDGTRWCGLYEGSSEKKALKREDRCCKKWHNCPVQIQGYRYDYMMYNYRPHKLVGCDCMLGLEACLRNVTMSSLAEEVLQVMFGEDNNSYRPVCLQVERREDKCAQWDKFYHKCDKYEWADYGAVRTFKAYRDGISMMNVTFTPHTAGTPTSDAADMPTPDTDTPTSDTDTPTFDAADMPTSDTKTPTSGADTPTSDVDDDDDRARRTKTHKKASRTEL